MASALFSEISLGGTLGVTLLGACVSSMLYGVTCLQTLTYFRSAKSKTDGRGLHILVVTLLICDTAHQAVILHIVYNYLVLAWANPFKALLLVWSIPVEVLLNGVLALLLNSFLTLRLWRLSDHNVYLTVIAAALSLANFGTNISYGARGYGYKGIFDAETKLRAHGIAGLSVSVGSELMISTSLAYYLYTSRTGLRRSNDIITRLIALTVTTGMLTTVFDVVDLIAYVTARDNLYVMFFNFLLGKLYANALLTSLNSREYVLGMEGDRKHSPEAIMLGGPQRLPQAGRARPLTSPERIEISVDQFINSDSDISPHVKFASV